MDLVVIIKDLLVVIWIITINAILTKTSKDLRINILAEWPENSPFGFQIKKMLKGELPSPSLEPPFSWKVYTNRSTPPPRGVSPIIHCRLVATMRVFIAALQSVIPLRIIV